MKLISGRGYTWLLSADFFQSRNFWTEWRTEWKYWNGENCCCPLGNNNYTFEWIKFFQLKCQCILCEKEKMSNFEMFLKISQIFALISKSQKILISEVVCLISFFSRFLKWSWLMMSCFGGDWQPIRCFGYTADESCLESHSDLPCPLPTCTDDFSGSRQQGAPHLGGTSQRLMGGFKQLCFVMC